MPDIPSWDETQWNEMVDLLTYVAAADRRTVSEVDVRVWLDAARDGRWPSIDFAHRAVVKFRNDKPDTWLQPGHITQIYREVRRQAADAYREPDIPRDVMADPKAYRDFLNKSIIDQRSEYIHSWTTDIVLLGIESSS